MAHHGSQDHTVDYQRMKKHTIFIVTYGKDFQYLPYCIKSIDKFANGFQEVVILVPDQDYTALLKLVAEHARRVTVRCYRETEWPDKGMLWHELQIMRADEWCVDADYVYHIDPDCVFTAPVSTDTFMREGKPVLRYERYETLRARCAADERWRGLVERDLPFAADRCFMRGHPEIYHRGLYHAAREFVTKRTGLPLSFHIRSQRNEFPQTFAEFPVLGTVAFHGFPTEYHMHDLANPGAHPELNDWPVFQAWSHNPPDVLTNLWWKGEHKMRRPIDVFAEAGLI